MRRGWQREKRRKGEREMKRKGRKEGGKIFKLAAMSRKSACNMIN